MTFEEVLRALRHHKIGYSIIVTPCEGVDHEYHLLCVADGAVAYRGTSIEEFCSSIKSKLVEAEVEVVEAAAIVDETAEKMIAMIKPKPTEACPVCGDPTHGSMWHVRNRRI